MSDLEIGAAGTAAADAGAVCAAAELFEGQRVEPLHHLLFEAEPHRAEEPRGAGDLVAEGATGRVIDRVLGGFELPHGAHDIAETDPPPLARQAIAAARAADPEQDFAPNQLLQHRLEIAAWDSLALGD